MLTSKFLLSNKKKLYLSTDIIKKKIARSVLIFFNFLSRAFLNCIRTSICVTKRPEITDFVSKWPFGSADLKFLGFSERK